MRTVPLLRRYTALVLVCVFTFELPLAAGLDSKKAKYVGGTVAAIKTETEGRLNADDEKIVTFTAEKGGNPNWTTPYDKVTNLAYGQHAGRRVGATIAWGVTTLGIMALPMLFSKKRRHYLTIEYTDSDGKAQVAIFELGKDVTRTMLKVLEVRTGKKVQFEDEEARKTGVK